VTSYWVLADVPLHKFDIDESLSRQIVEQKRRMSSGEMVPTSHTVLIVDQSGSMKNSDVMGHRSRSRGAYYTIANEMIAQPLINHQISFTDVVSIVEMRDEAVVTLLKEPVTWELHNKLVDLADDSLSAQGQGNYLPALSKAFEVLHSVKDQNCALLLLFLSDGGPSDRDTASKYFGKKKSMLGGLDNGKRCFIDIQERVSKICSKFQARLTFGAFGFANDRKNGKVFDLLRAMTQKASQAGAKGFFACGLDTENLRKALYSSSTSLISTRMDLSSLFGGSILRICDPKKVKRTDIVKDIDGTTHNFFHDVRKNNLKRFHSRKQFDRETKKENIKWDNVALMHPSATGLRVKVGYLGKGAERECREMSEITVGGEDIGQQLVGKFSINHEPDQLEFHKQCALTQFEAGRISKKFNDMLVELVRCVPISLPHIEFLPLWFYTWDEPDVQGRIAAILCERRLDSSRYKKWNDNKGGLDSLNKQLGCDIAPIIATTDEEKCLEGNEEGNEKQEELGPVNLSNLTRIIDDDVPQAFSHWSWQYTKGDSLVCDLQGVLGKESFQLTDPAIHSRKRRYGPTDHGRKGHHLFFATHKCSPLCCVLSLRHPGINPHEIDSFIREQFMKV
jgi:hypothetical protein